MGRRVTAPTFPAWEGCVQLARSSTLRTCFVCGELSMKSRRCAACGQDFWPRAQVSQQCYCPAPACQRERRRHWQQAKRQNDPDYHDNQARAQCAWSKRNPDYWRDYRLTHPKYGDRNRAQQRARNARRRERLIAKMDASTRIIPITSGTYQISPVLAPGIAKMDAWRVQITLLSMPDARPARNCKERT
jgi:hypothetical protein